MNHYFHFCLNWPVAANLSAMLQHRINMSSFELGDDYWKFARHVRRVSRHFLDGHAQKFFAAVVSATNAGAEVSLSRMISHARAQSRSISGPEIN